MKNSNKFFLGAIINYQILANTAWANAKRLAEQSFADPPKLWDHIINSYTKEEWASKWRQFNLHRFPVAHNRIWRVGFDIVRLYEGDCRNIWRWKSAGETRAALNKMRCGTEISHMIIGALINYSHLKGIGDVKADTHIQTVLDSVFDQELDPELAREITHKIYPDNPWDLDLPLYDIGKHYCRANWICCEACPLRSVCKTATQQNDNNGDKIN